jgi:hypothetical protein
MGQARYVEREYPPIMDYPLCLKCSVPMWFVRIAKSFDGEHLHFECVMCETAAVVSVLN